MGSSIYVAFYSVYVCHLSLGLNLAFMTRENIYFAKSTNMWRMVNDEKHLLFSAELITYFDIQKVNQKVCKIELLYLISFFNFVCN